MKILLFDIDGTLLLTGGAGLRAMNRAFVHLYGIEEKFSGKNLAGRTDTSIFRDAAEECGFPYDADSLEEFKEEYFAALPQELNTPARDKRLMPGVQELLTALNARNDVYLGLLTGNWRKSGYLKLAVFGLDRFFTFGAFSEDSEIRPDLLPYAVRRCQLKYNRKPEPQDIFVIGDTPSDIQCAKPHGAVSVAVAAAHYKEKDLDAFQPDHILTDFTDLDAALRILG